MDSMTDASPQPEELAQRRWAQMREQQVRLNLSYRAVESLLKKELPRTAPRHSTISGWLNGGRQLPKQREVFVGLARVLKLDEAQVAAHWDEWNRARAGAVLRAQPGDITRSQFSFTPSPQPATKPGLRQRLRAAWRSWHTALAGLTLIITAIIGAVLLTSDDTAGPEAAPTTPTSGAGNATEAEAPQCPSPTVRGESNRQRASATFCADRSEFLLYDDSPDGKSAILIVRVNGHELPAWYNSNGHATRSQDGRYVTPNPPRRITVSFTPTDTVEFRVCFGDRNDERIYLEDSCGAWLAVKPTS